MKSTSPLVLSLAAFLALSFAAQADDYVIVDTGTINSLGTFEPYVYGGDETVGIGTQVTFTVTYDDSVPASSYDAGYGTTYVAGTWSLIFGDQSYSGPLSLDDSTNITVAAALLGDSTVFGSPADGFDISAYDSEDNLVPDLTLQTNTAFSNENLTNLDGITVDALVQPSSEGETGFTLYDTDSDPIISASVDSLSANQNAVPEPSTWTLMVSGLIFVGLYLRRRGQPRAGSR